MQVAKTVELVKQKGGKVARTPGAIEGDSIITALVEDPNGYKFELLQRGPTPEPFCQVMLRVGDLDHAINFYKKVKMIGISALYLLSCLRFTLCTSVYSRIRVD